MSQNTRSLELPINDDYVPSDGELNNFVYLTCKYTVQWPMRQADLAICLELAKSGHAVAAIGEDFHNVQTGQNQPARLIKGVEGLTRLLEVTCEYLWDHISGEPDEFSPDILFYHMKPILQKWYSNTTPEERPISIRSRFPRILTNATLPKPRRRNDSGTSRLSEHHRNIG